MGNYTGDLLYFSLGTERPRYQGIAGDLAIYKIARAAAGLNLDAVERLAKKANTQTRSLEVPSSGCTLPGASEPLFVLDGSGAGTALDGRGGQSGLTAWGVRSGSRRPRWWELACSAGHRPSACIRRLRLHRAAALAGAVAPRGTGTAATAALVPLLAMETTVWPWCVIFRGPWPMP